MASETLDGQNLSASPPSQPGEESLSPLEQEVLDEYARLLGNMNTMSTLLLSLSTSPSAAILDGLRGLERKTSLVFTLLKASVYSIVLNQQITDENDHDGSTAGGYNGGGGRGGRGAGTDNVYERLATAEEQEVWRREKEGRENRRRDMDG